MFENFFEYFNNIPNLKEQFKKDMIASFIDNECHNF